MDSMTERLAALALAIKAETIPSEAVHDCKLRVIDALACAAAAFPEAACARDRRFAAAYATDRGARIWGTGTLVSPEMAGFVNGGMIRYLDFNDSFFGKSPGHPSDVIGGLLGLADAQESRGKNLVEAIVTAYEIYCGMCASIPLDAEGLDQSLCAAAGAAAGAGKLLDLDRARMENAISLAIAPNLGLFNVRHGKLSDWKGLSGPNGVRNGIFAALLARDGFTGPSGIFEGQGGLFCMLGPFEWNASVAELPYIRQTSIKLHPACFYALTAIDATLAQRGSFPLDEVAAIRVETYENAHLMNGSDPEKWAPTTRETADHSIPYTVAIALQDGVISPTSYSPDRMRDPQTRDLMKKIEVVATTEMTRPFPDQFPTRVVLQARDGRESEVIRQLPRGHMANPASDTDIEHKFMTCFAAWGDNTAASETLEKLWAMEMSENVTCIVDTICRVS